MGFDSASRFRLVEQATAQPGFCLITKSDKGPFVDVGLDLNKFDGIFAEANLARVYLSVAVLRELAEGAGLFEEIRTRALFNEIAAEERGYNEGIATHGDLASLADRFDTATSRIRISSSDDDNLVPAGTDDDEPAVLVVDGESLNGNDEDAEHADRSNRTPRRQSNGASKERGPASVSVDSSDGYNPFRI